MFPALSVSVSVFVKLNVQLKLQHQTCTFVKDLELRRRESMKRSGALAVTSRQTQHCVVAQALPS